MFKTLARMFSGFKMPEPAGPPRKLGMLGPDDALVSQQAQWKDGLVCVEANEPGAIKVFEFPLENEEQCKLTCRFQMGSAEVAGVVYPEMWVRVQDIGECFSKGLNYKLKGTNNWTSCELPFYLKKGQRADLLKFNLVFTGLGDACLKEIEIHSTPLKEE